MPNCQISLWYDDAVLYKIEIVLLSTSTEVTSWKVKGGFVELNFFGELRKWVLRIFYMLRWKSLLGKSWSEMSYPYKGIKWYSIQFKAIVWIRRNQRKRKCTYWVIFFTLLSLPPKTTQTYLLPRSAHQYNLISVPWFYFLRMREDGEEEKRDGTKDKWLQ